METEAIRSVQIFGERCSGTNYLAALISTNVPGVALTFDFGFKHWFIAGHEPRGRANTTTDRECIRSLEDAADTLFLVITRNPYDWVRSLHAKPYHAPDHWGMSFSDFLRSPWRSYERGQANKRWDLAENGFYLIEEAANVLALRTLKARHFLALEHVVPHIMFLRYETLVEDPRIIASIGRRFGIATNEVIEDIDVYIGGSGSFAGGRSYPPIDDGDLEFIMDNLDWGIEARFGYSVADYHA